MSAPFGLDETGKVRTPRRRLVFPSLSQFSRKENLQIIHGLRTHLTHLVFTHDPPQPRSLASQDVNRVDSNKLREKLKMQVSLVFSLHSYVFMAPDNTRCNSCATSGHTYQLWWEVSRGHRPMLSRRPLLVHSRARHPYRKSIKKIALDSQSGLRYTNGERRCEGNSD